jgi:hypothetical protein
MQRAAISSLISKLKETYGDAYTPHRTSEDEEDGTGFRIAGIAATFSVLCDDEVPAGQYDVRVEADPADDYAYNGIVSLDELFQLIEKYRAPRESWPVEGAAPAADLPPPPPDPEAARLERRLLIFRVATAASVLTAAGAAALAYGMSRRQPRGRVTGISDRDPSDPEGGGRGPRVPPPNTDNDPTDQPGKGKGGK